MSLRTLPFRLGPLNLTGAALSGAVLAALALAAPAYADIVASKGMVDAAKARGEVGEQADGFLGEVAAASPATVAAMREINAGRAEAYRDAGAKAGTSAEAARAAAARQLLSRAPPGQFIKPAGAGWTRK